ncbi:alpha/beta hydrolase [bacterium]|nr:alpha/beta hydrolase [bacterium]
MKEYTLNSINARLRYHDLMGDDTPVFFIHGLGCASSFDYPQVASSHHLVKHRRILIDLLGSGFSDKPDRFSYTIENHVEYLEDFINSIDIADFFIYGHSMGGAITISLSARFEKRLKGVILSESNLDSGGGFFSKKIAAYDKTDYLNFGQANIIRESMEESNEKWAASLSVSSPLAMYNVSKSLVEGQSPSWRTVFYSLKTHKTFIFGEHSLPDPDLDELKKHHIHIETVKNAGHSMAWENPEGLAKAIKKGINLTRA